MACSKVRDVPATGFWTVSEKSEDMPQVANLVAERLAGGKASCQKAEGKNQPWLPVCRFCCCTGFEQFLRAHVPGTWICVLGASGSCGPVPTMGWGRVEGEGKWGVNSSREASVLCPTPHH